MYDNLYRYYRTVLISIASMLNSPNISSPANVDAAVMYRKWNTSNDKAYVDRIRLVLHILFPVFSLLKARGHDSWVKIEIIISVWLIKKTFIRSKEQKLCIQYYLPMGIVHM